MQVTDPDARAWAEALKRADTKDWAWADRNWPTVLTDAVDEESLQRVIAPCRDVLAGFIRFAERGAFRFAFDD